MPSPASYETSIYVTGIVGAISQILAACVLIGHLATGLHEIEDLDLRYFANVYSAIGITVLIGASFSEVLLLRAVNQRSLHYIEWWMTSTFMLFIFVSLMSVIVGCTLYNNALWITLSFLYLVIRLPFQMYFVDVFAHVEIVSKPAAHYDSVVYHRF